MFMDMGVNVPSLDYVLSDYWHIELFFGSWRIGCVFECEFLVFLREHYNLLGEHVLNPVFYLYKYFCGPRMSFLGS